MNTNLPRNAFQIEDLNAYFEWEERQQTRVEAALAKEQRDITWGGHFVRPYREGGWSGAGPVLIIFGSVYTLAEIEEKEEPETVERLRNLHRRFLFAQCFSVVEPDGEPGDTNRWDLWPITAVQFNAARAAGWDPTDSEIQPWIIDAWTDMSQKRSYFTDEPLPPGVTAL